MKKLIMICTLLLTAHAFARDVYMKPGERRLGSDFASNDVITCTSPNVGPNPPNPPPPPPPPPPPRPVCNADSARGNIIDLENNIRRVAQGKCGNYGINRCGDNLEDHALADTENALANQMAAAQRDVETICSDRSGACDWYQVQSLLRDFDTAVNMYVNGRIVYKDGAGQMRSEPMPISRGTSRPYCR